MYVYTVLVQIAGGRAECPRHHGGPAGRRAGAHVCACMSIQYKYRQIFFWDIRRDCRMRERRGHVRREMSMMTLPTTRMEFDDGRARMLQEEY